MRSRTALAILLYQQGQHEAALRLNREVELFYRRLGDRPMLARVINNEGIFLAESDRWDEAAQAFEQASQIHRESGNLGEAATSLLNWAEILLDRGNAEQARAPSATSRGVDEHATRTTDTTAPALHCPAGTDADRKHANINKPMQCQPTLETVGWHCPNPLKQVDARQRSAFQRT